MNKNLWFTKQATSSGGISSVWGALRYIGKYSDVPDVIKASIKMNRVNGFDCPGCAWPDPEDDRASIGEYCENGIKALAEENTSKKADPQFFAHHTIEELSQWTEFELGKAGRITHPMILEEGDKKYRPAEWHEVFQLIADELNGLVDPDEAVFYTSGRTSNEAAFLFSTLARAFGTNNLPDCGNMCHETSESALIEVLGNQKGTVTLEDIHHADVIIVMGQNPGSNHPRMLKALETCKKNKGKIIAVNPIKEAGLVNFTNPSKPLKVLSKGTDIADLFLTVRINGDMAFLKAMIYLMWQREKAHGGIFDQKFIEDYTIEYEIFLEHIKNIDYVKCVRESGLSELQIVEAVDLVCSGKKLIICWSMGIAQHANGVETVREIVNILLLRGAIGKPGAGVCPVKGHSNVQGCRTMGISNRMNPLFLKKLGRTFSFDTPLKDGLGTIPSIKAMHSGRVKVFVGMGGNIASASPDTTYCAEALQKCNLTVQISTKINKSHLVGGKKAIIIPVLGRSEIDLQKSGYQFVSTENSMGIVQSSKGVIPPKSPYLKSEVAVICEIGKLLFEGYNVYIDWEEMKDNYDLIRTKIEQVVPGFFDYNKRIREKNGFYLPNAVKDRKFMTSMSKAIFTVNTLPDNELKYHQFQLGTIRSHDQFNSTIYGLNDRYRGVYKGRNVVFMNQEDMKEFGFKPREKINIHSYYKGIKRSVFNFQVIPYQIPRRNLMSYFPEANPLIAIDHVHHITHTPIAKNIIVELEKAPQEVPQEVPQEKGE